MQSLPLMLENRLNSSGSHPHGAVSRWPYIQFINLAWTGIIGAILWISLARNWCQAANRSLLNRQNSVYPALSLSSRLGSGMSSIAAYSVWYTLLYAATLAYFAVRYLCHKGSVLLAFITLLSTGSLLRQILCKAGLLATSGINTCMNFESNCSASGSSGV